MSKDTFKTIEGTSQAEYSDKKSKFIAFVVPVSSPDQAKEVLDAYRKEYYNARHVCWAYMVGHQRVDFRANDDGEPSGTAGKPILGQINSNELTDVLVMVVRYFGGIKLGTGGLIVAYREAAAQAIAEATIVEKTVDLLTTFRFEYPFMNDVMRIVKELEPIIISQDYDNTNCIMTLSIRQGKYDNMMSRLEKIESLSIDEPNIPE